MAYVYQGDARYLEIISFLVQEVRRVYAEAVKVNVAIKVGYVRNILAQNRV